MPNSIAFFTPSSMFDISLLIDVSWFPPAFVPIYVIDGFQLLDFFFAEYSFSPVAAQAAP